MQGVHKVLGTGPTAHRQTVPCPQNGHGRGLREENTRNLLRARREQRNDSDGQDGGQDHSPAYCRRSRAARCEVH